jgi:hypothetical protein
MAAILERHAVQAFNLRRAKRPIGSKLLGEKPLTPRPA